MDNDRLFNELMEIKKETAEIRKEIASVTLELAKQTVDLQHHIRRTDLAEKRIEILQKLVFVAMGGFLAAELIVKYMVR